MIAKKRGNRSLEERRRYPMKHIADKPAMIGSVVDDSSTISGASSGFPADELEMSHLRRSASGDQLSTCSI